MPTCIAVATLFQYSLEKVLAIFVVKKPKVIQKQKQQQQQRNRGPNSRAKLSRVPGDGSATREYCTLFFQALVVERMDSAI